MPRSLWPLVISALLLAAPAAAERRPPNIVVIVSDDLGAADLGYRGSQIRTPSLDRLAREGMQLDRFYVHPWCAPTRAAFMLGRRSPRYAWDATAEDSDTIAERFRDAGYQTGLIGKWHLGRSEEQHPNRHGFDYFYGMIEGGTNYYTKRWAGGPYDWQRNGETVLDSRYTTHLIGMDATHFVQARDPDAPFFLVVAFNAPHFPAQAPRATIRFYEQSTNCERDGSCRYMAQVHVMDEEIGHVLDALRNEGIENETIVVFFNDNGGGQNASSNLPFRGGKSSLYEGGIRVPAILKGAGPGASQQVMGVEDLWATLESAAGLHRRAPRESRSAWRAIEGGRDRWRRPLFYRSLFPQYAFRCDGCETVTFAGAVVAGPWKLVVSEPFFDRERSVELYDVERDPGEAEDLSSRHPFLTRLLTRAYERWDRRF